MTDRYVRMVNGVEVPMTDVEIQQRQQEEAAWTAEQEAKLQPPVPTPAQTATAAAITLPMEELLKSENAIPLLLGFFLNQTGNDHLIPALIDAAQPSAKALSVKEEIDKAFSQVEEVSIDAVP